MMYTIYLISFIGGAIVTGAPTFVILDGVTLPTLLKIVVISFACISGGLVALATVGPYYRNRKLETVDVIVGVTSAMSIVLLGVVVVAIGLGAVLLFFTSRNVPVNSDVSRITQPVTRNADWTPYPKIFDGVEMMLVPSGCFNMGENGEGGRQCFDKPFWMDRTEVTNAEFAHFGGQAPETSQRTDANHPRETVRWSASVSFCNLRGMRLPTESEWEYAARGPDGLLFTWGNDFVTGNMENSLQNAPVGSVKGDMSWSGVLDMSGSVREWTNSLYRDYPYDSTDGREDSSVIGSRRTVRGGTWLGTNEYFFTTFNRNPVSPNEIVSFLGFRCIREFQSKDLER